MKLHTCANVTAGGEDNDVRGAFKGQYMVNGKKAAEPGAQEATKLEAGIVPSPKARPREHTVSGDILAEQAYEI